MERHHYAFFSAVPTDVSRVGLDQNKIAAFYIHVLPEALMDVHPSIVFNVDEMGAELFETGSASLCTSPKTKSLRTALSSLVPPFCSTLHPSRMHFFGWDDPLSYNHHEDKDDKLRRL